jgi:hypothetical protein
VTCDLTRPGLFSCLAPACRSAGARRALELGLLGTLPGKTPDATMASALYTDIKKGGKGRSYFVRCAAPPADGPKTKTCAFVRFRMPSSCGTPNARLGRAAAAARARPVRGRGACAAWRARGAAVARWGERAPRS